MMQGVLLPKNILQIKIISKALKCDKALYHLYYAAWYLTHIIHSICIKSELWDNRRYIFKLDKVVCERFWRLNQTKLSCQVDKSFCNMDF